MKVIQNHLAFAFKFTLLRFTAHVVHQCYEEIPDRTASETKQICVIRLHKIFDIRLLSDERNKVSSHMHSNK